MHDRLNAIPFDRFLPEGEGGGGVGGGFENFPCSNPQPTEIENQNPPFPQTTPSRHPPPIFDFDRDTVSLRSFFSLRGACGWMNE